MPTDIFTPVEQLTLEQARAELALLRQRVLQKAAFTPRAPADTHQDGRSLEEIVDALRTSEATNRALLLAIPDLILRMDRDGIIHDFKPPREGPHVSPERFIGTNVKTLFPPDVAATLTGYIAAALDTGMMQTWEYRTQLSIGPRMREARILPCDPDAALVLVRDITERKAAETTLRQSEERFRTLADQAPISNAIGMH